MAAARASYTDEDRARVYVVLTANDGIVKRTARESGIPESTVRQWKKDWELSGPPSTEVIEQAVSEFTEEATSVRNMALGVIKQKLELLRKDPSKAKLAELTTVVGVLDDKVARAQGLGGNKVDHHHHLPAPDEIRELFKGFISGAVEAASRRDEELIDAEFTEVKPLELPRQSNP